MTTITVTWDEWTSLLHRKRDVRQSTLTLELACPSGSSNTLPICEVLTLCVSGETLWEAKSFLQARNNMVQKCRGDTLCSAVLEHPCSMTAVIRRTCKSFITVSHDHQQGYFMGKNVSLILVCIIPMSIGHLSFTPIPPLHPISLPPYQLLMLEVQWFKAVIRNQF